MKKEILIGALFLAFLACAVLNIGYLSRLTDEVTGLADSASDAAEAGDWARAETLAQRAAETWETSDGRTHIVLRHAMIESVEAALNNLLKEIYARSAGGTRGAARAVNAAAAGIMEIERIRWGSIF